MERKIQTPIEQLCKGLPAEIQHYMVYVKRLRFDEKPDYPFLKNLFQERFVKEGYEFDNLFDWVLIPMQIRSPFKRSKIPFTIERFNNEERQLINLTRFLIKEFEKERPGESNFSIWNVIGDQENEQ